MGNSVIYRPAYDAEVEYLESTGTQWIDTGVKPDSTYTFDCKVAFTSAIDGNYVPWGCRDMQNNAFTAQCFLFVSNMTSYDGTKLRLVTTNSWIDSENWNSGIVPIPNTMYELVGMTSVSNMEALNSDIAIFGFITNGVNNSGSSRCRIGYWKCYSNGVLVRDMIPVRIGQVGYLYDKVSKQLFANKGTGNFILGNDVGNAVIPQQRCVLYFGNQRSVGFERIYEEYEWLIGDGSAAINTTYNFESEDTINTLIRITELPSSNRFFYVYANDGANFDYTIMGVLFSNGGFQFRPQRNVTTFQVGEKYEISHNLERIKVNDVTIYNTPTQFISVNQAISVFSSNNNNSSYNFKGGIAYFSISDKINLIPCKLLQSIPAILDGNGIARQAEECGMWDKVSNRFYGNVANSGTFTVKGPKCYEEYKWLVGDGSAFLSTTNGLTGLNSVEWELSGNGQAVLNSFALTTGAAQFVSDLSYVDGSIGKIGIYDNNRGYFWTTKLDVNTLRLVSGTTIKAITINDVDLSNPNYQWNGFFILQFINRAAGYKVSKVTVDDVIHYVPCKLTHGIPASMDANGISRPAGTCGMWDKVNDKFYGNVANSGSFTVSND